MSTQCVLLNGDYTFLSIVHWKRALCLLYKGKTEVLKYSDKVIKGFGDVVIKIPLVMKLVKVIRMIYRNRVPFSKRNVFVRDRFTCQYCGAIKVPLTIDHINPVSRGGKSTFENCVTACKPCNAKKANRLPSESGVFLRKQPHAPTISEFLMMKMEQLGVDKVVQELIS
jgi:5-methylcytosine-specific restriction endonuclease McrA